MIIISAVFGNYQVMSCAKITFIKTAVMTGIYMAIVKDIIEFYRLSRKMYIKRLWLCFNGGLKKMFIFGMVIRAAAIYYAAKFVVFLFREMEKHGY